MDLRAQLARRSRDARWVAAALALGLIHATLVYALVQRGSQLPSALVTNRVLLFALWYVNVVLILVILFVLALNLIKLWLERRTGVLGARFKTKLVATYIGLSLVPVLALFFFASQLLQGAIDRWFSASLSQVLAQGDAVAHALQDTIESRNWRDAARLAQEIQGRGPGRSGRAHGGGTPARARARGDQRRSRRALRRGRLRAGGARPGRWSAPATWRLPSAGRCPACPPRRPAR